jgi:hypothetical protein
MNRRFLLTLVPLALAGAAAARADDLTGSDRLLCSAESIVVCYDDGTCETGDADALNVPKFIEVDLVAKRLSTTKASGLNRTSAIESLKRLDDLIVLQGVEKGRAYSFVIEQKTGDLTIAVAGPTRGVSAFGACTPLSKEASR